MKQTSFSAGGILFEIKPHFFGSAYVNAMRKSLCPAKENNPYSSSKILIEILNIDNAIKPENRLKNKNVDSFQKKYILEKIEKKLLNWCNNLQKSHETKTLYRKEYKAIMEMLKMLQKLDSSFFDLNHVFIHSASPRKIVLLNKSRKRMKIFTREPGRDKIGKHFNPAKRIPTVVLQFISEFLYSFPKCLFLHSTLLISRKKGFVFLAPSGGGKTTFSNTAKKAKVLSDEVNYVYKRNDKWFVGSLNSVAGKKIRRIEEAELYGIFYLKKGKKIAKRNVNRTKAISNIMHQARAETHKILSSLEDHKRAYNISRELVDRYNPKNLYFSLNDNADSVLENELKNRHENLSF